MTRSVRDNAELFNVIAGYDDKDSTSSKTSCDFTAYGAGVKGLSVGVAKEFFEVDFSAEVKEAVLAALKLNELIYY